MPLNGGQRSVGTTPVNVTTLAGPGQLIIYPQAGGTAYVGFGTQTLLSSSSGYLLPAGGLTVPLYSGNQPLMVVTTTPGSIPVYWVISQNVGQTGP